MNDTIFLVRDARYIVTYFSELFHIFSESKVQCVIILVPLIHDIINGLFSNIKEYTFD